MSLIRTLAPADAAGVVALLADLGSPVDAVRPEARFERLASDDAYVVTPPAAPNPTAAAPIARVEP